jgi:alginate O-acetyltransferase complex protein AlgJ
MRKKSIAFICIALVVLTVIPAINLGLVTQKSESDEWWHRATLYNFDFVLPYLSRVFYLTGISINPGQVIIGKDGWLYLGDEYEETISVKRRCEVESDLDSVKKIGRAMRAWDQWLKKSGIRSFHIMLGPDKGAIYPEFLPDWAKSQCSDATDALLAHVDSGLYIDPRSALRAEKSKLKEAIYYKTDTHWNSVGAWIAYRTFAAYLSKASPEITWLSDEQLHILGVEQRQGGDLSNFLRMTTYLNDKEVLTKIVSTQAIETEQFDYQKGTLANSGGNPPVIAPMHPLLVKSKGALNQSRVLWLRDSFGTSVAPYMAATFSEILQVHYGATSPESFAGLVSAFRPEYVFITVVERDARTAWFEKGPDHLN